MQKNLAKFALIVGVLALPVSAFASASITLTGGNVTMNPGSSYNEPGYSANSTVDGDITSSVSVSNGVNVNQPGTYTVGYNVTDSALDSDSASRSVTVSGWAGIADPCTTNHSCPCPMSADPISGNAAQWRSCVLANYPKNSDGSARVCRLEKQMPGVNRVSCAADQAGFGVSNLYADGSLVPVL